MTKAQRLMYRKGIAARKAGTSRPVSDARDGLAWAYYLGWQDTDRMIAGSGRRLATRTMSSPPCDLTAEHDHLLRPAQP